jgi:hypothetical protein
MKKYIIIIAIFLASCTKTTTNSISTTNDSFKILSYKTEWCACQSYIARIKFTYTIDTTGVKYVEITNSLRLGQNYSFRYDNSKTTNTVDGIDLAACNGCPTTYYCSIIYRNGSVNHLPEIRL